MKKFEGKGERSRKGDRKIAKKKGKVDKEKEGKGKNKEGVDKYEEKCEKEGREKGTEQGCKERGGRIIALPKPSYNTSGVIQRYQR